ncbi:MAG: PorP/SprF family type IX secretion system membrane protein [Crocinitomicaceae bacterium]
MKYSFIILFFFFCSPLWAQQEPLTTQFWNHYSFFNPAMSGVEYKHQASVTYRDQWGGFTGNPRTFLANYNTLLKGKHGLGVNLVADEIGLTKTKLAVINYNYRILLNEEKAHFFTVGLGVGFGNTVVDYSSFLPIGLPFDPSLLNLTTNYLKINAGAAYHWKNLLVGVGSTQINGRAGSNGNYLLAAHFFGMVSYNWNVGSNFTITPRFYYRTDLNVQTTEVNALFTYMKKYSLGIGVGNRNVIQFIAQYDVKEKFRIGYSMEIVNSKLNNSFFKPTHEFVLGYVLK